MAKIIEANQTNFKEIIASGIVLADFGAPWCNPCKMLLKILDQVAPAAGDDVTIAKVNVDENKDLAAEYKVLNLPRVFVFKNGEIKADLSGVQSKPKLLAAIESAKNA